MPRTKAQKKAASADLKGWAAIAAFLAIAVSVIIEDNVLRLPRDAEPD